MTAEPRFTNNAAITVEFDLKCPRFIRWQRRDRLALHRFNERSLFALPNRFPTGFLALDEKGRGKGVTGTSDGDRNV